MLPYVFFNTKTIKRGIVVGFLIMIAYLFTTNLITLQQMIANTGSAPEEFQGVGTWLDSNTEKGDIIFNLDWGWFPQLYYYSPDSYYVAGMEPRSFYVYDEALYWKWIHVRYGYVCSVEECLDKDNQETIALRNPTTSKAWYKTEGDAMAAMMVNDFKTHYVMSSYQYPTLNEILDNNKHFKKVYGGNRKYYIYKIDL